MAVGLPEQLARDALRRALQRAAHAAAFVCLATALLISVVSAVVVGRTDSWWAVGALAAMTLSLVLVAVRPTLASTLLSLLVGGVTVYVTTLIVMSGDSPFDTSNNLVLALPRVALVLVGGVGATTVLAITWAVLGFAVGEVAALAASGHLGTDWAANTAAAFAAAVIVAIVCIDRAGRRSGGERAGAGSELQLADRRARELAMHADRELRATARLHDTALTHLVAIASAGSGPVEDRLRAAIRQDLARIAGPDWAIDQPEASAAGPRLDRSMTAAEHAGLEVHLIGDTSALGLVTRERAEALDDAVAQCLVNVSRHAGVDVAEVAIGVGDGELTIAVMDAGVGFDTESVPGDRIGLKTSIRGRIERVGGAVRLWSTRGVGTTIVLSVPTDHEA
ncbi:sensor histidine kinase [Agromyces aerolatus]|uniref:sensor histidine kinase n=1 Tax=Agromyces sp. LY-1074 TaxID=3074080 RepID=UPI0028569B9C|nr:MULTISPECIES: ATP-binding protein [unclassified Agromyces]MDR5701467.1 hypothetical protein [Agromyces sp. LY-1074]MDR5704466.1 hypothetical protein [Agromyces sp. LY-1358]